MVSFVDVHRDTWPVAVMCRTIGLPERTYHAAVTRPPSKRSLSDEAHKLEIRRVWEQNYRCYGARRIFKQLHREGYPIARCTVTRLMGDIGICGVQRGKKRFTTIPDESAPRPADLVERRFVAERPNQLWLADITYASTWDGWLYVAFILDVHSRMIVGWQLADHLRTDLVLDALEMALWRRDLTFGDLIHHSDRGCQGGFNWSSQHLDHGGADGTANWMDEGADGSLADEVAGGSKASAGDRARVLACDRDWGHHRAGGDRGGRGPGRWEPVVPAWWRDASNGSRAVVRSVPVVL